MKKTIAMLLALALCLALAACGGGNDEQTPGTMLVGTWEAADGNTMDFATDGTGHCYTTNGLKTECTWKYLEESNEFELAAMAFGKANVTVTDTDGVQTITWYDVEYTKAG